MNSIICEKSCKDIILKSKFYSYIFNCENIKRQTEILKNLRAENLSCSHICFAGVFENEQHSSDDGEPSGTAGIMILSALKENDVINALCVVVRYFGGVKLGVSKLGKVYKSCAKMCLADNIKKVNKHILFFGKCNYNTFDEVKNFLQKNMINLENVKFESEVEFGVFLSENEKILLEEITPLISKQISKIY